VWQFQGPFHIDSSPAVVGGRVYVGSGLSRTYRRTEVVCLDAASGAVVWRTPVELPAWGSPVADGDQVFVGLGNGRLNRSVEPPEVPAGALLCLDAATGRPRWRHAVADGVLARPTVAAARVYFGARDGYLYALGRHDGSVIWRTAADGPVVTAVALSRNRVYAAAATGQLKALDAATGAVTWTYDAGARTRTRPQLFAAPVARQDPAGTCVYLGAELRNAVNSAAAVFCLEERADGREP
jgi:outer membrane protein assembly factor BamB